MLQWFKVALVCSTVAKKGMFWNLLAKPKRRCACPSCHLDNVEALGDLISQMKLIKLFFSATCYRPGSVVGDLWWLAGGHVFVGQVHYSKEAYEKRDGTFRKFKGKLASQNASALENKIPDNYIEDLCEYQDTRQLHRRPL